MGTTNSAHVLDETKLNTIDEVYEQTPYCILNHPDYPGIYVDAARSGDLTELIAFARLSACQNCRLNRKDTCIDKCSKCAAVDRWNALSLDEQSDLIETSLLQQGFRPLSERTPKPDDLEAPEGMEYLVGKED